MTVDADARTCVHALRMVYFPKDLAASHVARTMSPKFSAIHKEPAKAEQQSSKPAQSVPASHPPAFKPVSLAPLKFEEAVTALSRVVPPRRQRPGSEWPSAAKGRIRLANSRD